MAGTSVLERPKEETDTSNEENFAHYAEAAKVTEAYVLGTPIVALCGKTFIPHRNPEKLRVCPPCKAILDALYLTTE